ncbi:MAG: secondary thiamine-phosphate synthase enzyme YjbQ [Planctomycetes bacterium]|jgi:secondary thiamine-phosphate synthase enzyme|nr:secondary thiamine-phosphate synthase enzyme YjbQ [Planctomycetota bacterium]
MVRVINDKIRLSTGPEMQVVDVTGQVEGLLAKSGLSDGTVTLFVQGSTAGITTVEFEPGLVHDLEAAFERIAPRRADYAHDARWGDGNGHAHVRASLIGPSLTVPFSGGKMALGTWQQVVFVDFDPPPRTREIAVQFMGQ